MASETPPRTGLVGRLLPYDEGRAETKPAFPKGLRSLELAFMGRQGGNRRPEGTMWGVSAVNCGLAQSAPRSQLRDRSLLSVGVFLYGL